MKAYKGVDVQFHSFLISARMGVGKQLHVPAALPLRKQLLIPTEWVRGPLRNSGRFGKT